MANTRMAQSPVAQLIAERMAGDLESYIAKKRADGRSWRRISLDIYEATGVEVTAETLRRWVPDIEAVA